MLAKFGLLPNCTDAHFYPKIIAVFLSIQRTLYICNGIPKIVQGAGYINVNSPTLVVVFSMKKTIYKNSWAYRASIASCSTQLPANLLCTGRQAKIRIKTLVILYIVQLTSPSVWEPQWSSQAPYLFLLEIVEYAIPAIRFHFNMYTGPVYFNILYGHVFLLLLVVKSIS